VPIPDRETIKANLLSLIRQRHAVTPSEAYVSLACDWQLSPAEINKRRSGRKLYEHEIRWARQELVIERVLASTDAAGKGRWRLAGALESNRASPDILWRLIEGFLDPNGWFLDEWLPRYEATVANLKRALAEGHLDQAVDLVWKQQDNSVSHAGQGVLAAGEIEVNRDFLRSIITNIGLDASPDNFEAIVSQFKETRAARGFSKVPYLLIARAFATIAPDRYHTTVDHTKHERIIGWFEQHTMFRASAGNWALRANELTRYLNGIGELHENKLLRNMFPWFVFTQLTGKNGRPVFTPGHRPRAWTGAGRRTVQTERTTLRHNLLVERLHSELIEQHGQKVVGTEQPSGLGGYVDAIMLDEKRCWIYEVKVADTASDAIRQALGQLLEYGYRDGGWHPQRIFIVAEPKLDAGSGRFLKKLRTTFRLPVQYRQLVID
jgi:hypothetical protein